MADIKLEDLAINNNIGADLFSDSESFLKELTDDSEGIYGGLSETSGGSDDTYGCIGDTCKYTLKGCWDATVIKTVFAF